MCLLELNKVLMYEFYYDYIKNKYYNNFRLLFTDSDSLMYESKAEDVYEHFSNDKEMFDFNNYWTKSKYYGNSNRTVTRKMKDETGGVATEKFFELKAKLYAFLVDNSEHKKAKGVNRNAVAVISYNEYKDVLLNN